MVTLAGFTRKRINSKTVFHAILFLTFAISLSFGFDTKQLFEQKYACWQREVSKFKDGLSDPSGTSLSSFKDLLNLGIPALPYFIEKMQSDPSVYYGVLAISRRTIAPEEWPLVDKTGDVGMVKFYTAWWYGGQRGVRKQFFERYERWKDTKQSADSKKITYTRLSLERLGIAALPYFIEEIQKGRHDLIPMISRITQGVVPETASSSRCISWWLNNSDTWRIPFPD